MHSSFEVQEDEKDEGQYKSQLTEKEGTANNDAGEVIVKLTCVEFGETITNNDERWKIF